MIWLAGILEGEGTFDAHRGKYARIRIAMVDRDVIGRAATLMDTSVRLSYHPEPAQPVWHAEISGKRAEEIMMEILPTMGTRRSQRIASVLSICGFREDLAKGGTRKSIPGPAVSRPLGIIKPATSNR